MARKIIAITVKVILFIILRCVIWAPLLNLLPTPSLWGLKLVCSLVGGAQILRAVFWSTAHGVILSPTAADFC